MTQYKNTKLWPVAGEFLHIIYTQQTDTDIKTKQTWLGGQTEILDIYENYFSIIYNL